MTEVEFGKYPQDPEAYVNGKRISIVDGKPQFNPLEQQLVACQQPMQCRAYRKLISIATGIPVIGGLERLARIIIAIRWQ